MDSKDNDKLFSKLAVEGVKTFVAAKDFVVRRNPCEDEEVKPLREESKRSKLRYLRFRSEDNIVSLSQFSKKLSEVYTSNECKFCD